MTLETFYLLCFLFGLSLTFVSFVFGAHLHLPVHVHLPHGWHVPRLNAHGGNGVSPLNMTTILMFLTWFGGTGYLMTRYHSAVASLAFLAALLVGFSGGSLMYLWIGRVFVAHEHPLRDSDFEMVGVLGRLGIFIREGGTGELIYSQQGTRRSCAARSEDGSPIERGTEVIVMRYEKGIAYVRRWEDLHRDESVS